MFKAIQKLNFSLISQFRLLVAVALLISLKSHSHEFLSQIQNTGGSFVPVIYYQFNKQQMVQITAENGHIDYYLDGHGILRAKPRDNTEDCEFRGSKTCGQFDHVSTARSAAIITCYQFAQQQADLYPDGLIPSYSGPSSFVSSGAPSPNHHMEYYLDYGLSFSCGYISFDND